MTRTGYRRRGGGPGAPVWQGASTFGFDGGAPSITVDKPTGTASGDLLIAHVMTMTLGTEAFTSSGWTHLSGITVGAGTPIRSDALYKIAGASEPNSYTFDGLANAGPAIAAIHRINGVSQSAPINTHAIRGIPDTDLQPDPVAPSVTTTARNCLVLSLLAHDHDALDQTHSPTAGHTEGVDFGHRNSLLGLVISAHAQHRAFASAGATGSVVHDCTETVATNAVVHRIAVAP